MNRTRHGVALVIVVALAALTLLALRPPEQAVVALPPAEVVESIPTTTTTVATTTTTAAPGDRDAEIEEILRDFYYGWFDGLYRHDVDTIDRIAGSQAVLEQGIGGFDRLEFTAVPTRDAIGVDVKNVLLDRADCLVVSADIDFRSFVATDEVMAAVDVFFRVGDGWGRAISYEYEQELWLVACDHMSRR
ncbi:MAG TPA: hypothetical protein VMS74_05045 [Acidimicrobiia bacterium]|nr:hypothetical protein [Acidimicrobiia bacterium]